jgi:hypothetical protein
VRPIREIVTAVVSSDAALQNLRHDPAALGHILTLSDEQVSALRSADRFFESEQPIADRPGPVAQPLPPAPGISAQSVSERAVSAQSVPAGAVSAESVSAEAVPAQAVFAGAGFARAFTPPPPPATGITATPDTGTLRLGPNTGTYTIVSSASATSTPVTGAPGGPAAPGVPRGPGVPQGPGLPSAPAVPAVPDIPRGPAAPVTPTTPVTPTAPGQPAAPVAPVPCGPPPCPPGTGQVLPAGCAHGECEAAIVAIVANVAVTATTAITAIAQQGNRAGNRHGSEVSAL